MIDREKVTAIFRRMDGYMRQLQLMAAAPPEQIIGDPVKFAATEHFLQLCAESCIGVANHIIAAQRLRAPQDYADTFAVRVENQIVPETMLPRLQAIARFRNLVVHLYWEIDPKQVYAIMRNNLDDFQAFEDRVLEYLQSN
ncbi:MAG TPA: DUF86 domain-containing protein [Anaerolineae bacterium]|nr:DUF86 domain-containing protein [Anaerolineae bacterium]